MPRKLLSLFLCIIVCYILTGCSGFERLGPGSVERAWGFYEDYFDDYDPQKITWAIEDFKDVIEDEPDNGEAYNGLGWCYGLLCSLSTSVDNFNTALEKDSTLVNPYAGLAFVYSELPDHQSAVNSATTLIQKDPLYQFAHISSPDDISVDDVRLVKAKSLCSLGDFSQALAEVQILNPSFSCNVSTPEGREALLSEIERLRGII